MANSSAPTASVPTASGPGALSGLKVLDLSRVLGGPYCAQILADHGADVIKIEPPQGDETRTWGPPFDENGLSAYFNGANRNKRCLALDLSRAEGRELLFKFLEHIDILIENFKPGTLEGWGIGFDVINKKYPKLIHCQISGFGEVGPLGKMPGYDAAAQAWSGVMSVNGDSQTGPMRLGLPIVDIAAGMNACIGILAAVFERSRSGLGQKVSTSLFETGLGLLHPHGANFLMSDHVPQPTGSRHSNICPYDLFATKTSPLFLAVGNNTQFEKLCKHIGAESIAKDLKYADNKSRLKHNAELKAELEVKLSNFDSRLLAEELMQLGVPAGPVLNIKESFAHPQAQALSSRVEVDGVSYISPPVRLSRTKAGVRAKAEGFAESRDELLKEIGLERNEILELEKNGLAPSQPKK